MADLNIQGIYNRLKSGSQYTPLSAETFGDWSMEAGDLITAQKDGQSFASPVMKAGLKWHGAGTVTVESNGQEKREPLSVISKRKYSGGGGGYWNSKKAFTKIEQNDNAISLTASRVDTVSGNVNTLTGRVNVMADRISGSIDVNGKIIASAAIEAITDQYGNLVGQIKLQAEHIYLDGDTTLNGVLRVTDGMADFIYGARFGSSTTIFPASGVQSNNFFVLNGQGAVNKLTIADLTVSGNTLTIKYADGRPDQNFSKAVTLDGAWDNGVFTVTAPGATPLTTTLTNTGHWGNAGSGEDENTYYYATYATIGTRPAIVPTENTTTINAQARWDAGYTEGRASVKTMTPTAINVYTSQQGTLLSTRLSESILTAGKFITMKVGNTTYSIQIT